MSVRVGVVGWGDAGKIHARHLIGHGARLTGVVSRRNPGKGLPWFETLDELFPHVDAVSITTPNDLHAEMVIQAVRAGKGVLVEKPLCITSQELEELQLILPNADRPVHLGYRLRFNDTIVRLKDVDRIPTRVQCTYKLGIDRLAPGSKSWIRDRDRSGGPLFVLGIHCLDLVRWLANARARPISELVALSGVERKFPLQVSLIGKLQDTQIGATVDLRGSAPYHLSLVVEWPGQPARTVSLAGEEQGVREEAEYSSLTGAFLKAVEEGKTDPDAIAEILQTHRELLEARRQIEEG